MAAGTDQVFHLFACFSFPECVEVMVWAWDRVRGTLRVPASGRERSRMLASAVPLGFAAKVSRWACMAVVSRGRPRESRAPGDLGRFHGPLRHFGCEG